MRKIASTVLLGLALVGPCSFVHAGVTVSTRTTLHQGDPGYAQVAAWIAQRHAEDGSSSTASVGVITVLDSGAKKFSPTAVGGDSGPPVALPVNGEKGQQITITNDTPTLTESWTYEWSRLNSAWGWVQIHYERTIKHQGQASP